MVSTIEPQRRRRTILIEIVVEFDRYAVKDEPHAGNVVVRLPEGSRMVRERTAILGADEVVS